VAKDEDRAPDAAGGACSPRGRKMRLNPRVWLHRHSLKLLAIRDTPEAIAGGVAIGIFFGFVPLFGLKTLSAILLCWLTRSNIIAAILACTAHDIIFPLMPAIYFWEYGTGYWLLNQPHHWPKTLPPHHGGWLSWRTWMHFLMGAGKPMLVGGCILAAPFAALAFVLTRTFVSRHQRKKRAQERLDAEHEENPS
jgi:uncharacterized protein